MLGQINLLIGFKYIVTQEEFEQWQLANPQFSVCNVIPHLIRADVTSSDDNHAVGNTVWGSFITYTYPKP